MGRYPLAGPASTIACPRHGLAVALSAEGYIVSSCPACVRAAQAAEAKHELAVAQRRAEVDSWSISE